MRAVLFLAFAIAVGPGCADSPDLSSTAQHVLEGNRIASNRIASNQLSMNRIASNRIASNRIASNRFTLNQSAAGDLVATPEGRELLLYVVQCALPGDVQLEASYEGVHYEFGGDIGLAPQWLKRELREGEQRWVSACLIARVNKDGKEVSISIRGPNNAILVTEDEAEQYTVEEGAFYGNVFVPPDEPIVWVACTGRDKAVSELGSLGDRKCTEPDPENPGKTQCGFTYAGDCADFAPPKNPYACKRFVPSKGDRRDADLHAGAGDAALEVGDSGRDSDDDRSSHKGGYYAQCHDAPGNGRWPEAERFKEVITVFLQP